MNIKGLGHTFFLTTFAENVDYTNYLKCIAD